VSGVTITLKARDWKAGEAVTAVQMHGDDLQALAEKIAKEAVNLWPDAVTVTVSLSVGATAVMPRKEQA
jgi:molybdopterin biosynthesis enzyme